MALTSRRPEGPIQAVAGLMWAAFPQSSGAPARWGEPDWVAQLLIAAGADDVRIEDATQAPASDRLLGGLAAASMPLSTDAGWGEMAFRDASPEAWLAEHEEHHPVWRWASRTLGPEAWAPVHEEMIAALADGNEDPGAFLTTSRYLVVRATAGS